MQVVNVVPTEAILVGRYVDAIIRVEPPPPQSQPNNNFPVVLTVLARKGIRVANIAPARNSIPNIEVPEQLQAVLVPYRLELGLKDLLYLGPCLTIKLMGTDLEWREPPGIYTGRVRGMKQEKKKWKIPAWVLSNFDTRVIRLGIDVLEGTPTEMAPVVLRIPRYFAVADAYYAALARFPVGSTVYWLVGNTIYQAAVTSIEFSGSDTHTKLILADLRSSPMEDTAACDLQWRVVPQGKEVRMPASKLHATPIDAMAAR